MKKLTLWMMALAALQGTALQAQNITGDWQGTLEVPQRKVRVLFKIALENDKLKATLYTIDQPNPPIATTISRNGSTVKMTIPSMGGNYDGKLSADGNSITGTFSQGAQLPLNLARATPETAWTIPEPPPSPARMPLNAKPEFAVATIKPSPPDAPRGGYGIRGEAVTTTGVTVNWMIKLAFNVHAHQISGSPAWLDSERYDTVGKPDVPGQPSRDQMKLMIQKLLADRFQLRFHTEKKELPVYAMVVAKGGPKITVSAGDPNDFPGIGFGREPGVLSLVGRNTGLNGVANGLQSNILDKPVVDQTGLAGRYDFTLRWTPDATQWANFGVPATANAGDLDPPPDIFTAFEKQLGLKLQPTKAVIDVMVIDRIERPSPN
jgi:uncharacterized protein (TIGR03435 family)